MQETFSRLQSHYSTTGKGGGKEKYRFFDHKKRNPCGFAGLMVEHAVEDGGEYAAYVGVEDEDDRYNDPACWYDDDDDAAEPESAYPFWEDEDELQNITAYISDEWSAKYDVDATAETAFEAAKLECVACLFDALGTDC